VQVLHVNSGHNVFGPDWRANATIGRAVQLALSGWRKQDVRAFLYEPARPVRLLQVGGMYGTETHRNLWPRWVDRSDPETLVPPRASRRGSKYPGGWWGWETLGVSA
jgi:hypothetical protein